MVNFGGRVNVENTGRAAFNDRVCARAARQWGPPTRKAWASLLARKASICNAQFKILDKMGEE
jgi:hypothetical protein